MLLCDKNSVILSGGSVAAGVEGSPYGSTLLPYLFNMLFLSF